GLQGYSGYWGGGESITDTRDALESLELECNEKLFDDIVESFINNAWYPCAHGHWLNLHEHEKLRYAWDSFVDVIKHRTRYFFILNRSDADSIPNDEYAPLTLLGQIGKLVQALALLKALPARTHLYRVRRITEGIRLEKFEEIGPPPKEAAGAGRMNPPGINYFYLALEPETAVAEVVETPPCHVARAKFATEKELLILDLTVLPPCPSIFDGDHQEERDGILFLKRFIEAIASPVSKDGREHVDYIPSQVVSEYFAQVFSSDGGRELNGIMYPSVVRPGGKNVVIFPQRDFGKQWGDTLKLQEISHLSFRDWDDLKREL
ncbi:MAG: RES domain-containing protein, partial [Nitrososphaera sp.]|nr:RES domain-containing protein [Nitrososphaera sp.]